MVLKKGVRCAIYTRKSTEHGLELEFNSLDAQRDACEAYIKSQASEGWTALAQHYDDPAFSGGNLERPALQKLLQDIKDGKIDTVVVYKIDRLTRSLADFAKLVELFDANSVSFVAVTQQFNTTTSMGRLTLNILLSFAQFERELSSERVRDKVAASRRKGKWMGGNSPFGYRAKDKRLSIDEREAKIVRYIFKKYLQLGTIEKLLIDLDEKNIRTRATRTSNSKVNAGNKFTYGPLAYLLNNRIYIGEVRHKEKWFAGEHKPILPKATFEEVQSQLKRQSIVREKKRSETSALLTGLLFDDRGNRMSPTYTVKKGVRYRFYVNSKLLAGRPSEVGSVMRISAPDIEELVIQTIKKEIGSKPKIPESALVEQFVERISLSEAAVEVKFKSTTRGSGQVVTVERKNKISGKTARIYAAHEHNLANARLLNSIARAHHWIALLSDGKFNSVEELAASLQMHPRAVGNSIRLAFLSPRVIESALEGKAPLDPRLAMATMTLPLSWNEQEQRLLK